MRKVIQKPSFRRAYKKLNAKAKELVDEAIRALIENPNLGVEKKGDLAGLFVYKFKLNNQEKLLAYVWNLSEIMLVYFGTYENFYRDLKKSL